MPPVDASLLDEIRGVDSVELAMGGIYDEVNTKIVGEDGKAHQHERRAELRVRDRHDARALRLQSAQPARGALARGRRRGRASTPAPPIARTSRVGDTVEISTLQPKQDFEVVGIAQYGDVESLGTATFAIFDVATAQTLFDREGEFDAISVAGAGGHDAHAADRGHPADPARGRAGEDRRRGGAGAKDEISEFTTFIRYFLLAFAGIALFVGSFVIFNTLSITVAQRTREFATLRTLGARAGRSSARCCSRRS